MVVDLNRLPVGVLGKVIAMGCPPDCCCTLCHHGMAPGSMVMVRYRSPRRSVTVIEHCETIFALSPENVKGIRVQWRKEKYAGR